MFVGVVEYKYFTGTPDHGAVVNAYPAFISIAWNNEPEVGAYNTFGDASVGRDMVAGTKDRKPCRLDVGNARQQRRCEGRLLCIFLKFFAETKKYKGPPIFAFGYFLLIWRNFVKRWYFVSEFQNGLGFFADFLPIGCELGKKWKMLRVKYWRVAHFGLAAHDIAKGPKQLLAVAFDKTSSRFSKTAFGFLRRLIGLCFLHLYFCHHAISLPLRLGYHCGMNKASLAVRPRILVIGAGIIGASFAYHLARGGAMVTVIDSLQQGGGLATAHSWAWINSSWGNPEPYFRLRKRSMELWRELQLDLPGFGVNWCGGLLWDLPEPDLRAYAKRSVEWSYGARLVEAAEISALEPRLINRPSIAVHVAEEGMVEPVQAAQQFLKAAQDHGAQVKLGLQVEHLSVGERGVGGVMTSAGEILADVVVLAAGVATAPLLKPLGLDFGIDAPPGLLVHSKPTVPLLRGLVMSPRLHVRQTAQGRLVAGTDFGGMDPGDDPDAAAAQLFAEVKKLLRGTDELAFDFFTLGHRPTPRDGVSAVGQIEGVAGLYVCVTHSGITLAPVLGALGAREILQGQRDELLLPFMPDRLITHHP